MSAIASFSAPDWHWYSRSAVLSMTAWVSSWAAVSSESAAPGANLIWSPSQKELPPRTPAGSQKLTTPLIVPPSPSSEMCPKRSA